MIAYVEDLEANDSFILVVDHLWYILREYGRKLTDQDAAFTLVFKTLIPNDRVCFVRSEFQDGIAILPAHLDEIVTDDDDKKFVAVADKHPEKPPIVNATDRTRGWAKWEDRLRDYGIEVIQLCPSEP